MLRMCVSTVFGLRKSASAICRVRLSVDDEPCDLELSLRQRFDSDPVGLARARAPVDAVAKKSEFAFCCGAVSQRAVGVEVGGGGVELGHSAFGLPGLCQCPADEDSRDGGLDWGADLVGGRSRGERLLDCVGRIAEASATAAAAR